MIYRICECEGVYKVEKYHKFRKFVWSKFKFEHYFGWKTLTLRYDDDYCEILAVYESFDLALGYLIKILKRRKQENIDNWKEVLIVDEAIPEIINCIEDIKMENLND